MITKKFFIFGTVAIVLSFAVALGAKSYRTTHNTLFYANLDALANPEDDNGDGGDGGTNPGGSGGSNPGEGGGKGNGWFEKNVDYDCPILEQIIVYTGCGDISAGVYTPTSGGVVDIAARLIACGGSYTIVGAHTGRKSYCESGGWNIFCQDEPCH